MLVLKMYIAISLAITLYEVFNYLSDPVTATRKFVELGSPERPAEVVLQHGAEKRWSDFSRRLNQWRS
jgi:hypothetical protein